MGTPVLVRTHPTDNGQHLVLQTHIVLTFDEPVQVGGGVVQLVSSRGTITINIGDNRQVLILGNTVIINPTENLLPGTTYYVDMAPGVIVDMSGNPFGGITDPASLNFTTVAPAANDLNGDGVGDLMFRNGVSGQTVIWYSQAGGGYSPVALIPVGPEWSVVDAGDFNGDGRSDLLWRNTAGEVVTWDSTGNFVTGRYLGAVPTAFKIEEVGDFTGDGRADILWRHTATGEVTLWTSRTDNTFGTSVFGSMPPDWQVLAAGDFNRDNREDVLWRNATGNTQIWFGSGAGFTVAQERNLSADWTVLGTGDIDFDTTDDILMINAAGDLQAWFGESDGFTVVSLASRPAGWTFEQFSDMDGDGRADIVWRAANGDVMLWTSQPTEGTFATSTIAAIPNEWEIF